MFIQQFFEEGISHLSYLLSGEGACIIIDPNRDVKPYLEMAGKMGLAITHVLETHLHADFLSGHMDLQKETGAAIVGPKKASLEFPHTSVSNGDSLQFGSIMIDVIETPGHTPEHVVYVVRDLARGDEPCAVFSGDTLFVGDVGRPDLFPGMARELSGKLFESLKKLMELPDFVEVYPAHAAGSLCGKAISSKRSSTIGYERRFNESLQWQDVDSFRSFVLKDMPAAPDHFSRCSAINRKGPSPIEELPRGKGLSPQEFARGIEQGAIILDVRDPAAFGGQHIKGSINIDAKSNFATFAGWVLPPKVPILIVADCPQEVDRALEGLHRVGFDDFLGWLEGGIYKWALLGYHTENLHQISVQKLRESIQKQSVKILDVRSAEEFKKDHIQGAINVPFADTRTRFGELGEGPVSVICSSGQRSTIVCSILMAKGVQGVMNVPGGMTAWMSRRTVKIGT